MHIRAALTLMCVMPSLVVTFFLHATVGHLSPRGFEPRFTPKGAGHTTRPCGVPHFLWKNHAHYINAIENYREAI